MINIKALSSAHQLLTYKEFTMDRRSLLFVVLMTTSFFFINQFLFPPKTLQEQTLQEVVEKKTEGPSFKEHLYVIENPYQQLVISSVNGAVAEINLPLQSETNTTSVIKKIDIDAILEKDHPAADRFPLGSYKSHEGIFTEGKIGGYYPLLRRSLSPHLYGLTLSSETEQAPYTEYKVKKLEKNLIELEGKIQGSVVKKRYILPNDPAATPYTFELEIESDSDLLATTLSTGIPEVEIISGSASSSINYLLKNHRKKEIVQQIKIPKKDTAVIEKHPEWVSNANGFFAVLLSSKTAIADKITAEYISGKTAPSRICLIDTDYNKYPTEQFPGYNVKVPLKSSGKKYHFHVFAGPLDSTVLEKNDAVLHQNFEGMQTIHGWFAFISEPFAQFLFFLMKIFYSTVHSWGFSIILLTIALRLMMYPLNTWSIRSTLKLQKLSPKLAAIQERNKKDPKKAQIEIMNLYKENGVNPLGGCLPLIIQMPFLMGMFDLLKTTFELRGVSFIPGWITNLTAPDVLFSWSMPLWIVGNSFHLLPVLLGVVMYYQQQISSPKTAKTLSDQQKQQKMMGNVMVIVFTILFYKFPSGLNLYWLSSMLLAILQQVWTKRRGNFA